jgi:hypothetical protein
MLDVPRMFKSSTVIVVGAGASAEFGLPTGAGVYKEALALAEPKYNQRIAGFSFQRGFKEHLASQQQHRNTSNYDLFKKRVRTSVSPSIDRLAWLNADIAELCRAFSAWSILRSQYEENQESFSDYGEDKVRMFYTKRRDHLSPFVLGSQNWIAKCADKWLGDAEDHSELDSEIITFVSFNYDRIIEEAFQYFVTENHRFSDTPPQKMPKVMHVHGGFPSFPDRLTQDDISNSQASIKYIEDGGESEAVRRARIRLDKAKHIIAIGFDFDSKNVELIELAKHANKIHALNFDGNRAFDNRVLSLGVPDRQILRGSSAAPLGVSQAAARGFFDGPELFEQRSFFDNL